MEITLAKSIETVLSTSESQAESWQWEKALASYLTPMVIGVTLFEWGLFCQHIHWDLSRTAITITLLTLGFVKFAAVLLRYIDGQEGISFREKAIQVTWTCASLPLLFYVLMG